MSAITPYTVVPVVGTSLVWILKSNARTQDAIICLENGQALQKAVLDTIWQTARDLVASRPGRYIITDVPRAAVEASAKILGFMEDVWMKADIYWTHLMLGSGYLRMVFFGDGYDKLIADERSQMRRMIQETRNKNPTAHVDELWPGSTSTMRTLAERHDNEVANKTRAVIPMLEGNKALQPEPQPELPSRDCQSDQKAETPDEDAAPTSRQDALQSIRGISEAEALPACAVGVIPGDCAIPQTLPAQKKKRKRGANDESCPSEAATKSPTPGAHSPVSKKQATHAEVVNAAKENREEAVRPLALIRGGRQYCSGITAKNLPCKMSRRAPDEQSPLRWFHSEGHRKQWLERHEVLLENEE